MHAFRLFVPIALLLGSLAASAQEEPRRGPPLWEVGGFALGVSQQAYPGSDEQLDRVRVLPYALYRGKVLRADGDSAGLRAVKTERYELDLGVSGSFGAGNSQIRAREGMRELGTLVELGPRLKIRLGDPATPASTGRWRLDLPLRGVFDLNDSGRHRGMAFEPQLVFERQARGGWRYSSSVGAIVADRRLGEHFYGVSSAEALPWRPAYRAKSGLVAWRVSASASYGLSRDWRLFGFARLDSVAGAANEDSPLVRDRTGASFGIGISYTWMRSEASAYD
jgi:outer membrane protein